MTVEQTPIVPPAIVNEWIAHFERENGRKPTDTAIRIASLSYDLGRQMADRGYNDAQCGYDPLPFSTFESAAKADIARDIQSAISCAHAIAQLLYDNYMIGYNGEKEDCEE